MPLGPPDDDHGILVLDAGSGAVRWGETRGHQQTIAVTAAAACEVARAGFGRPDARSGTPKALSE